MQIRRMWNQCCLILLFFCQGEPNFRLLGDSPSPQRKRINAITGKNELWNNGKTVNRVVNQTVSSCKSYNSLMLHTYILRTGRKFSALKIIILLTIWLPSWRFGWGVAIVTWQESSAWGLERGASDECIRRRPIPTPPPPDFSSCRAEECWLVEHTYNLNCQQKELREVDELLWARLTRRDPSPAEGQQVWPLLPTFQASSAWAECVFQNSEVQQQQQQQQQKNPDLLSLKFLGMSVERCPANKTCWDKLASAGQSCRFRSTRCSEQESHVTFWHLGAFLSSWNSSPSTPTCPFRRWELVHTASKCHFIRTAESPAAMNSVQKCHTPPIRLRSDCTENSHRHARAQKLLGGGTKEKLTMPKETSRKHSIHNTATISLFYIKKTIKFWK